MSTNRKLPLDEQIAIAKGRADQQRKNTTSKPTNPNDDGNQPGGMAQPPQRPEKDWER